MLNGTEFLFLMTLLFNKIFTSEGCSKAETPRRTELMLLICLILTLQHTPCVHVLLTSQCHSHAAQQCYFPVSITERSESKNWTLHHSFSQSCWAASIKVHKLRAAIQAGGERPECQSTAHTHTPCCTVCWGTTAQQSVPPNVHW